LPNAQSFPAHTKAAPITATQVTGSLKPGPALLRAQPTINLSAHESCLPSIHIECTNTTPVRIKSKTTVLNSRCSQTSSLSRHHVSLSIEIYTCQRVQPCPPDGYTSPQCEETHMSLQPQTSLNSCRLNCPTAWSCFHADTAHTLRRPRRRRAITLYSAMSQEHGCSQPADTFNKTIPHIPSPLPSLRQCYC
jgi:hypothetical protein